MKKKKQIDPTPLAIKEYLRLFGEYKKACGEFQAALSDLNVAEEKKRQASKLATDCLVEMNLRTRIKVNNLVLERFGK